MQGGGVADDAKTLFILQNFFHFYEQDDRANISLLVKNAGSSDIISGVSQPLFSVVPFLPGGHTGNCFFDDVREYIPGVHPHGPELLRHNTGRTHARNGVHFQKAGTSIPDDIVYPDNAFAVQVFVDGAGKSENLVAQRVRNAGRGDLPGQTLVLGLDIEEFGGTFNLGDGKYRQRSVEFHQPIGDLLPGMNSSMMASESMVMAN
jgi:hypothetical protein